MLNILRQNPDMEDQEGKFSFFLNNARFEINPNFDIKSGWEGNQTMIEQLIFQKNQFLTLNLAQHMKIMKKKCAIDFFGQFRFGSILEIWQKKVI